MSRDYNKINKDIRKATQKFKENRAKLDRARMRGKAKLQALARSKPVQLARRTGKVAANMNRNILSDLKKQDKETKRITRLIPWRYIGKLHSKSYTA